VGGPCAATRTRGSESERERERENTREGRRACEKREREKERTRTSRRRASERSERERGDTRARKEREERERERRHAYKEEREREREKERTRASGRLAREKGERQKERANESENERREHSREGPRKRRRGKAEPAQQRQQWGLRHNRGSSGDFVGVDWSAGATPQARRGSTRWRYLLDCGPQRDGAGELLPSPALFAEAPDRRLAKVGGMREFTTRLSTDRASVRMRFKEMAPFFFRVLEQSAPTTLTSWGRHPVRTPTTVASHDSRTPVSGGHAIGLWCRWSWEGTFATPILVILGATSSADDHHRAVSAAS
jgi:hypothetical protein